MTVSACAARPRNTPSATSACGRILANFFNFISLVCSLLRMVAKTNGALGLSRTQTVGNLPFGQIYSLSGGNCISPECGHLRYLFRKLRSSQTVLLVPHAQARC